MKIEILQEDLLGGLNTVMRAVSSRVQLPILSSIKFEVKKTEVILSATDLEIGIKTSVPAKSEDSGEWAIPAKSFGELLSTLSPGKLEIRIEGDELIIKSSRFEGKLVVADAKEYPIIPESDDYLFEVSVVSLRRAVEKVSFASAKDSLRPALTGILIEIGNGTRLVATDGFRLAVSSLSSKGYSKEKPMTMLVPARALVEGMRCLKDGEIKVGYLKESKQIFLRGESGLVVSQIIEGGFPDYNRILPKEFSTIVVVSREDLLEAARSIMVFAKDSSNLMKMEVGENELLIMAESSASGAGRATIEAKVDGEKLEVSFNVKYIIDELSLLNTESVWIGLGGKLDPGMIAESENDKDKSFYVVMPINA